MSESPGPAQATGIYLPDVRFGREQQMAAEFERMIVQAGWQQRRRMKRDAVLVQVAQNRARFLAQLEPDVMHAIDDVHRFPFISAV